MGYFADRIFKLIFLRQDEDIYAVYTACYIKTGSSTVGVCVAWLSQYCCVPIYIFTVSE